MLVATLTFVIVFFPVIFLTGMAKLLFQPIAVSAILAIVASYFLALTLIPAYCSRFLPELPRKASGSDESQSEGDESENVGSLANAFGGVLKSALSFRYIVLLDSAAAFAFSVWFMVTQMGRELFPQVDSGQMTMYVRMPTGTRIEVTEQTIIAIEDEIVSMIGKPDPAFAVGDEQIPDSDLQLLVSNIGVLLDWPAAYTPNAGAMDSFMLIQTKGKKDSIFRYVARLRESLREKFPGVDISFDTGGMLTAALNMGEPSPIHFQIRDTKLDTGFWVCTW